MRRTIRAHTARVAGMGRFWTPSKHLQHTTTGAELDGHAGPVVHQPDVVFRVHSDRVRPGLGKEVLADLSNKHAVGAKLVK